MIVVFHQPKAEYTPTETLITPFEWSLPSVAQSQWAQPLISFYQITPQETVINKLEAEQVSSGGEPNTPAKPLVEHYHKSDLVVKLTIRLMVRHWTHLYQSTNRNKGKSEYTHWRNNTWATTNPFSRLHFSPSLSPSLLSNLSFESMTLLTYIPSFLPYFLPSFLPSFLLFSSLLFSFFSLFFFLSSFLLLFFYLGLSVKSKNHPKHRPGFRNFWANLYAREMNE